MLLEGVKFPKIIYLFKDILYFFYSQTFEGNHATLYGKYTPAFLHAHVCPKTDELVARSRLLCFVIAVVARNSFVEMHPLQFGVQVL